MNEYEKRLEEARRARMQDVRPRTDGVVPPRAPQKNRIEEALGKSVTSFGAESAPVIPPIAKPAAPAAAEVARAPRERSYGAFLKRFFLGCLALVLIAVIAVWGRAAFQMYMHPQISTAQEVVRAVGKLVSLPQGEQPTVATVSDLAPLKDQPFFKDAAVGDKVLIYKDSKKAILYRPSENKVITVAPLGQ